MSKSVTLEISPKHFPTLDKGFAPAALWNVAYRNLCKEESASERFTLALQRTDGTVSVFRTHTLPHEGENKALNVKYTERLLKFLLWQKGGYKVFVAGSGGSKVIS